MVVLDGRWHKHPHVRSGNELSWGERAADTAVRGLGSWTYILIQTIIVVVWIIGNVYFLAFQFDKYPFILLNLAFSTQAAYAAPIILLASRRQDARNYEMAKEQLAATRELIYLNREQAKKQGIPMWDGKGVA